MNEIEVYKINEILENKYYQIPQELFVNDFYKQKLNSDAKIIYGFLLDRLSLSIKNNWINEKGEIYLIFTRQEVQEKLNLSDKPVCRAFKQLTETKLIYEKRQGLGKPNLIFVGKIQHQNIEFQNRTMSDSRNVKNTIQESYNVRGINTNNINTNISNNNLSITNNIISLNKEIDGKQYEDIFKENIEYDILIQDEREKGLIENITNIAIEVLNSSINEIKVNGENKSIEIVRSQLLKLNPSHIRYVINCLKENTKPVRNVKSYIITTLYNSVNTINIDTTVQVAAIMNS